MKTITLTITNEEIERALALAIEKSVAAELEWQRLWEQRTEITDGMIRIAA